MVLQNSILVLQTLCQKSFGKPVCQAVVGVLGHEMPEALSPVGRRMSPGRFDLLPHTPDGARYRPAGTPAEWSERLPGKSERLRSWQSQWTRGTWTVGGLAASQRVYATGQSARFDQNTPPRAGDPSREDQRESSNRTRAGLTLPSSGW